MFKWLDSSIKLSDSQLNKWKLVTKATEVILKLSSNIIVDSNDETFFHAKCY